MSIKQIEIKHFRSIDSCVLTLENVNLFIGENGTGKSNILDAVRYFFESLLTDKDDEGIYDINNKFSNEFSVSITFDFTRLQKISRNNVHRNSETGYADYYDWISRQHANEIITLRKIKGEPIRWNKDRQYRQNIANLFPLYYVDARSVELTDWHQLWEIIGDLMKVHRSLENEIAQEIEKIKAEEKYKLEERYDELSAALNIAGIQLKQFTPKQYASTLSSLMFKGNEFSANGGRLQYLSNGTNAFNYTNLLMEILKLISEYKIKDPIIILDEPEISLHHKLIDQMCERIMRCSGKMQFLSATHSARLLKNMLKWSGEECKVIHISSVDGHSVLTPIKHLSEDPDNRSRIMITDQHSNAYFSRFILSVEGASETEVFTNRYLQELFPALKQIDVFEGMSDNVVQSIISPRQRHFRTQYLSVIDMDKVVCRKKGANSFDVVHKLLKPDGNLQKRYYYSWERDEERRKKKRIRGMAEKCRFHFLYPFYGSNDSVYHEFVTTIKEFFLSRNIYVCKTTIEGVLINGNNFELFWKYYSNIASEDDVQAIKIYYDPMGAIDRLNLLRLLVNGKSDMILSLKEIQEENTKIDPNLCRMIVDRRNEKTSGWITHWIDYCLLDLAGVPTNTSNPINTFCTVVSDPQKRTKIKEGFSKRFPELAEIVELIEKYIVC